MHSFCSGKVWSTILKVMVESVLIPISTAQYLVKAKYQHLNSHTTQYNYYYLQCAQARRVLPPDDKPLFHLLESLNVWQKLLQSNQNSTNYCNNRIWHYVQIQKFQAWHAYFFHLIISFKLLCAVVMSSWDDASFQEVSAIYCKFRH